MGNWDRRDADALAVALSSHLRKDPAAGDPSFLLAEIHKDARQAASITDTDAAVLTELRRRMCHVCRGNSLYVCDVPSGWSVNCAFLKSNLAVPF